MNILSDTKTKIGSILSSIASTLGLSSSGTSVVCQSTCSASSGILPFLGVSLAATPFTFISQYQTPIWWLALSLFILTFWLYRKKKLPTKFELGLLFINGGLLSIGAPYFRTLQAFSFVTWSGIILLVIGVYRLITAKKFLIKFTDSYEAQQTN